MAVSRLDTTTYPIQVSKDLDRLILQSIRLQYKIELAKDGLEDGPPGGMVVRERLQSLLKRRIAWSLMEPTARIIIPDIDSSSCLFGASSGCHFAWPDAPNRLNIIRIPSRLRNIAEKRWSITLPLDHPEHEPWNSALKLMIDPDQNLLVVVDRWYVDIFRSSA